MPFDWFGLGNYVEFPQDATSVIHHERSRSLYGARPFNKETGEEEEIYKFSFASIFIVPMLLQHMWDYFLLEAFLATMWLGGMLVVALKKAVDFDITKSFSGSFAGWTFVCLITLAVLKYYEGTIFRRLSWNRCKWGPGTLSFQKSQQIWNIVGCILSLGLILTLVFTGIYWAS